MLLPSAKTRDREDVRTRRMTSEPEVVWVELALGRGVTNVLGKSISKSDRSLKQ